VEEDHVQLVMEEQEVQESLIIRAPGSANLGASPGTNTVTTLPAPAGGCKVATFTVSGTLTT
jgi:hypothetical protein